MTTTTPPSSTRSKGGAGASSDRRLSARHPLTNYHILLGATLLLLVLGLAMVLSASTIVSYRTLGSPYTLFLRQLMFAAAGLVLMVVASRLPVAFYRRMAYPMLGFALALLIAVLVIGVSVAGQKNWIDVGGPFRIQPSEFAKLALVLWSADLLARKQPLLDQWKHLLVPLLPVTFLVIGLVLAEGDVGNVLVMIPMAAVALAVAGAPGRLFALGGLAVVAMVAITTMTASYRLDRFKGWLNPEADPNSMGWQVLHGKSALGGGGWFGVGLGGSREKWDWLPAAHTDFIFAVVGEELGVIGTVFVVVLFAAIAVAGLRVAMSTRDRFVRIAAAMVVAWLLTQALLNLGAVLQLLPITGVPLPLVSYGGSSLLPTLGALGMLMSFARDGHGKRRRRPAINLRSG